MSKESYRQCTHCGTKWTGDPDICPECGVGFAWVNIKQSAPLTSEQIERLKGFAELELVDGHSVTALIKELGRLSHENELLRDRPNEAWEYEKEVKVLKTENEKLDLDVDRLTRENESLTVQRDTFYEMSKRTLRAEDENVALKAENTELRAEVIRHLDALAALRARVLALRKGLQLLYLDENADNVTKDSITELLVQDDYSKDEALAADDKAKNE